MVHDEALDKARAMRRQVLGDEYVDAQTTDPDPAARDFQDHITRMAWGAWARGGPLTTRDRSLLVLAMTAALGRMEEFRIHLEASGNAGVTAEEVDELLFQIAGYCGGPAGLSARRVVTQVRSEASR